VGKLLEVLPGSPDVLSYHDSRKTHPFGLGYHFIGSQTAVGASPVGMDVEVEYWRQGARFPSITNNLLIAQRYF